MDQLTSYSEMFIIGTYCETWYSMVCEQTCSCGNEMDKSMWQTLSTFDLIHSPHMWIQTILLCGKHNTTLQTWIVSRLWFCRRPWRLEVNIRGTLMHFRKSHVRADTSDVQEPDFCITQFYRSWNYFSRCKFTHGWDSSSHSPGFGDWSTSFLTKPNQTNKTKDVRVPRRNLSATPQSNMRKQIPTMNTNPNLTNIDHVPSSGTHCLSNAMLYVFEDNEAVIKMIIKGRSPTMRHVSRTHRVALDCLFDRIVDTLTPNINSQIFWPKVISHVTDGTIFLICSTSAISALLAALRIPAW